MEALLNKSVRLVRGVKTDSVRYLFDKIVWNNRLIGIKGARGTGKTTLLLQRLKALSLPPHQATYWTLDDLYFTDSGLADTARLFYNRGGRILFLDEVHKYPAWSQHIKNLYDEYDDLQIIFTGSSIIDIAKEEVDLSRRALMYTLYGMSYREYMNFKYRSELPVLSFGEIISGTQVWQDKFPEKFRPLEYFAEYLQQGYYPFSLEDEEGFATRLQQVIRIIVEYDMAQLSGFDIKNAQKLLQLLYILSANVPFKPNISELARKSHIHRNTINEYLHFLEEAQLIRLVYPAGISVSTLQKPEKIFLNNSNLAFALAPNATDKGNLRETFFASQMAVHHKISLPKQGDFTINDTYVFEIGGKQKGRKQIEGMEHAFVVVDDVDFPALHIPLWVFGMLY
ncbi:hypothetical protein SAMN02927921_03092 [Sinomicrobium oceani]|uniref:Uncharacterized protein n=1 Tax=Sinomicrobium oceani TaxID=1150368 RepID=A0A1K1R1T4_9FLAO|nr:AAA family ATPase [Sinomicrobium oceani]SFW66170.1 hypothetical protein SAMN02927921_03092 [Sinomicrobium oceani]